MPNNYILLDRIELNNTATSVTFDNIPQTGYTDLKIVASTRGTLAQIYDGCSIEFNGSTTGYSWRQLQGSGSAASSASGSTYPEAITSGASSTASTFGSAEFYIPNAFGSSQKSVSVDSVGENNATTTYARMQAGLWTGTAAITSIKIIATGGSSFVANSTFSLYGIAKVGTTPVIAPKADGGNIIGTDGTYWYHAFLSSGTFTPQVGLNADVLVVAGGGGGGCDIGGGGGAGGLYAFTAQSLATTGYAVAIGAGGAGGTSAGIRGSNGANSTFGSLTPASVGGGGGGSYNSGNNGFSGGSGGGGGHDSTSGGAGTSGQGFAGGRGNPAGSAGGGGGATAVGGDAGSSSAGNGGAGSNTYSSWATATSTGVSGYYAGGGGGAKYSSSSGGTGGAGGGGAGGIYSGSPSNGTSGTANTGGGAGGGSPYAGQGGTGGSGIVIIRYPIAS
jgi:hypothetical protein